MIFYPGSTLKEKSRNLEQMWFRAKKKYNSQAYCTLRNEMKICNLGNEKETGR